MKVIFVLFAMFSSYQASAGYHNDECASEVRRYADTLGSTLNIMRSRDTFREFVYYVTVEKRGYHEGYWIGASKSSCLIESVVRDKGE